MSEAMCKSLTRVLMPMSHIGTDVNCMPIILLLFLVRITDETMPGALQDYCDYDVLEADCPPGQIIVMEEARFGRMKLGSCLATDFGYLDCYKNILTVLDGWCSGRQSCNVKVYDLNEFRSVCTMELPGYLQARYTCQTVIVPDTHCCQASDDKVILATNQGLISNYVTQQSGCGGVDCPWVLQASEGRLLNISLLDFGTYQMNIATPRESEKRICNIYAIIKEAISGARVTVCSGETRHKHLYSTVSSTVEIQIIDMGENGDASAFFAIAFQAVGCSNPVPPAGGFVERQGDRALIVCESTDNKWEIICQDGEWQGDLGDCSESETDFTDGNGSSYFTREVYMVLVIAIAFVLAVGIITTGIVCLYRHWAQIPSDERGLPLQQPPVQCPDGTYLASEFNYSLPRPPKGYDTVGYKHHNYDRNDQADPRFWTNVRPDRENDKGYYSDRTYESPVR